jgi:periplasmic copper chaperone A
MPARVPVTVLFVLLATILVACGSAPSASLTSGPGVQLAVRDGWLRAADAGGLSAAYLTITNETVTDDALLGVSAPDVATSVSLHETTTGDDGMTGMHHAPSIAIPASGTVVLEPGGFHVMLDGLRRDLVAGETVQLKLTFERAGPVTVDALVRAG